MKSAKPPLCNATPADAAKGCLTEIGEIVVKFLFESDDNVVWLNPVVEGQKRSGG